MRRHEATSWEMTSENNQTRARLTCFKCGAVASVPADGLPTEWLAKCFKRKGWHVDVANPRYCFCPDHQKKERKPMNDLPAQPPPPALKIVEMTTPDLAPSPDQKVRIRHLLDSHFDDKAGRYLDNWTDQKVASDVGVGWKAVEQIRRLGWGELKEDPALLAIRADYETCKILAQRYDEALTRLKLKIDDLEKRLGFKPA